MNIDAVWWHEGVLDLEKNIREMESQLQVLEQDGIDYTYFVNDFLSKRVEHLYLRYYRQRSKTGRKMMRMEWRNYSVPKNHPNPLDGFEAVKDVYKRCKANESLCRFIKNAEINRSQFNLKYQQLHYLLRSYNAMNEAIDKANTLNDQ